jgi:hypothetical protein
MQLNPNETVRYGAEADIRFWSLVIGVAATAIGSAYTGLKSIVG